VEGAELGLEQLFTRFGTLASFLGPAELALGLVEFTSQAGERTLRVVGKSRQTGMQPVVCLGLLSELRFEVVVEIREGGKAVLQSLSILG